MDDKTHQMAKQKFRGNIPEVILPDFPDDENTVTTTVTKSRRVSFGSNFIKEFIVGSAVSAQCVSEYEQAFTSSDSSNANSSHSALESGILNQNTYVLEESHKENPIITPEPEESSVKRPMISSTICFSADSPTADMQFTEGCISLAKSILDKKNKEMTVIIQAKPKDSKEEVKINICEETKYFEGSQLDMSMTKCFKSKENKREEKRFESEKTRIFNKYDDEMSFTKCDFKMRQSKIIDDDDESENSWLADDCKENQIPINMIMQHLDKDDSDVDKFLFNPEKSLSEVLNANLFNTSGESEHLNLNESMDISKEFQSDTFKILPRASPCVKITDSKQILVSVDGRKILKEQVVSSEEFLFKKNNESLVEKEDESFLSALGPGVALGIKKNLIEEVEMEITITRDEYDNLAEVIPKTGEENNTFSKIECRSEKGNESLVVHQQVETEKEEEKEDERCTKNNESLVEKGDESFLNTSEPAIDLGVRKNVDEVEMDITITKDNLDEVIPKAAKPTEENDLRSEKTNESLIEQVEGGKEEEIKENEKFTENNESLVEKENGSFLNTSEPAIDLGVRKNIEEIEMEVTIIRDEGNSSADIMPGIKAVEPTEKNNTFSENDLRSERINETLVEQQQVETGKEENERFLSSLEPDIALEMRKNIAEEVDMEIRDDILVDVLAKVGESAEENNTFSENDLEDKKINKSLIEKEDDSFLNPSEPGIALGMGSNEVEEVEMELRDEGNVSAEVLPKAVEPTEENCHGSDNLNESLVEHQQVETGNKEISMEKSYQSYSETDGGCGDVKELSIIQTLENIDDEEQAEKDIYAVLEDEPMEVDEEVERLNASLLSKSEITISDFIEPEDTVDNIGIVEKEKDKSYNEPQVDGESTNELPLTEKSPSLMDSKILEDLKEQSKEPGCIWTLKDSLCFLNRKTSTLVCKFTLVESSVCIQFTLLSSNEDTICSCSDVSDVEIFPDEDTELRLPEYKLVIDFGFEKLKKYFGEKRKSVKSFRHVPYFLDLMNLFTVKMNSSLRQLYSILTLYPGSKLTRSTLSFRLFSFPLFFSCRILIDLIDFPQIRKSSVSFATDFGNFDKNKITEIFHECTKCENPLCDFIIKSTKYLIDLEKESGCVSVRKHIQLLPSTFHL